MLRSTIVLVALLVGAACAGPSERKSEQAAHLEHLEQRLLARFTCEDLREQITLPSGVTLSRRGGEEYAVLVNGEDFQGLPWQLSLEECVGRGEAWAADVNSDGVDELLIVQYLSANGWCAEFQEVTILTNDALGRPIPWHTTSWYGERMFEPLADLGDWDGDGLAEMIQLECYGYAWKEGHADGYYGWQNVYETDGLYWRKLSAEEVEQNRSVYQRVAAQGRDLATSRPEDWESWPQDIGNRPTGPEVTVAGLNQRTLQLSDGRSCDSGGLAVLVDRPAGRDYSRSSYYGQSPLLDEVHDEEYPVRLAGQGQSSDCQPILIWATTP